MIKLDDIVNEYNNTYHKRIKIKLVNVKNDTYIDSNKEVSDKDPKFKVVGHVRIWSEEVFVIEEVKNTVSWINVINDLNGEEIIGTFYEKVLQKTNQGEFRIEKIIKKQGDKLDVKLKGYDSSFNSWIDKKDLIK